MTTSTAAIPLVQFVAILPPDQQKALVQFALHEAKGLVDIQAYIAEAYEATYDLAEIAKWKQVEIAQSPTVTAINLETSQYHGISERNELEYQLTQVHNRLEELYGVIRIYGGVPKTEDEIKARKQNLAQLKELGGLTMQDAYKILPSLLQQEGTLIEKLNKLKFINDRAELILSGSEFALRYIEKQSKNLPQAAEIVAQLCKGAWAATTAHVEHQ